MQNSQQMNQELFICFCRQQVQLSIAHLKNHISQCQEYQARSYFYQQLTSMLAQPLQAAQLLPLKAEFELLNELVDTRMRPQVVQSNEQQMMMKSAISFIRTKNNEQKCNVCQKMLDESVIIYIECCFQTICRECILKKINKDYVANNGLITCPICSTNLDMYFIEQLIGKQKKSEFDDKLIEIKFNIVKCVKCDQKGSFEVGSNSNLNIKDPVTQQIISKIHVDHYVNNRFTCFQCRTEQCKGCKALPYHLGMLCDEFALKKASKRCRYCDEVIHQIDINKPLALQDICANAECAEKSKLACPKMLQCGHPCRGFAGEQHCLPCLDDQCRKGDDQKADDYCNICYAEGLGACPCIQSACGHIFHYECIMKRLQVKWNGPRIVFNFCFCALCKQWLQFQVSQPQSLINEFNVLLEDVKKKSIERLKYEGREKDDKVCKVGEPFYQMPQEYAMAVYCYYLCFKCQKPYFGGGKDCQRGMEDDKKEFDPKELVCANCCSVDQVENCGKHGKDYIEFKCKFCCQIAIWFCWGSTHFCEDCHKKQCNGDYVSKYPKDKLPKCTGKEKCPLKVDHKPNGEECSLGCALCRNVKANAKNF